MPHKAIATPKQLLVEGKDDQVFFETLLKHMELADIQVQKMEGVDNLKVFLKALKLDDDFPSVRSLGIVRDADADAQRSFVSVCQILRHLGFAVSAQPTASARTNPQTSMFIFPDSSSPGMLETLGLQTVQNDPAMICVEQYFSCLQQRLDPFIKAKDYDKAKAIAFLASRQTPTFSLDIATRKSYWNLESAALNPIKDFLRSL